MNRRSLLTHGVAVAAGLASRPANSAADPALRKEAEQVLKRAASYWRSKVARHGGYVYHYSLDLKQRWGEGEATPDQIWVQPPGTPAVGLAYLQAHAATRDPFYLDAATETAVALLHGQLQSGGWTNSVDFSPNNPKAPRYRNGKGNPRGRNQSSLDDGIGQTALQFLARADQAHGFKHPAIHEGATIAADALLKAQFPCGAFPQGWQGPVASHPALKASYPSYDWRTEGRVDNYWDYYTLNDGLAGTVSASLTTLNEVYKDEQYRKALMRLGDFLLLAQMPDPQPVWAQQYSYAMHPIWARRFEPAAVTGGESQDVLAVLMDLYRVSRDAKYLAPVPRALEYLKRSLLPDGRLARYYELKSNRPLYMTRSGRDYSLTYDDRDLPDHYGWKVASRLDRLQREYQALKAGEAPAPKPADAVALEPKVRRAIADLDAEGRWVSTFDAKQVGQFKLPVGTRYLASDLFNRNVALLSDYLGLK